MTSRRTAPKSRSPPNVDRSGVDPNFDIFTLPVEGGSPQNLVNLTKDNPADDNAPLYSPDGRLLAFRQQPINGFYADRARLMLFDRRGKQAAQSHRRVGSLRRWPGVVAAIRSSLFGTIDDAGTRRIYRFDVGGGAPKPVTREHSFGSLAIAGSGPVIVGLRQSFTEPPTW